MYPLFGISTILLACAHQVLAAVSDPAICKDLGIPVICPRDGYSGVVSQPPNIFSQGGYLNLDLIFMNDHRKYCYMTPEGFQSPTLRLKSNDILRMNFKNCFQQGYATGELHPKKLNVHHECGSHYLTNTSTNLHFHGAVIPAYCHQDMIVNTMVNFGEQYRINFSVPDVHRQSPGMFWYHPHVQGVVDETVDGGASGVLIVEGIENVQPAVQGLPEQIIVLRDSYIPEEYSINFVPFNSGQSTTMLVKPKQKQFWRILNAAADAYFFLHFEYDNIIQNVTIVSIDGVPVFMNNPTPEQNVLKHMTHILIPPAGRLEIILETPDIGQIAYLKCTDDHITPDLSTANVTQLIADVRAADPPVTIPKSIPSQVATNFAARANDWQTVYTAIPNKQRILYFQQINDSAFFLGEEGHPLTAYNMSAGPLITVFNNVTEDWIIQNRVAYDGHVFHIHQGHFMLLQRNGQTVPREQMQFMDNVPVPPGETITIRIDFRNFAVGEFVFHCHILFHEDNGMMQKIVVKDVHAGTTGEESDNNNNNDDTAMKKQRDGWRDAVIAIVIVGGVLVILLVVIILCLMHGKRMTSDGYQSTSAADIAPTNDNNNDAPTAPAPTASSELQMNEIGVTVNV